MHITKPGDNIFADLGFETAEALSLQTQSKRIISEKLAIKDQLMSEISEWMRQNHLKQAEAAEILGVARPRISDVTNMKSIKFTIDALVDMLSRTGKRIQFTVL
jgi:predicted XRE-type DNA-binding protein